MLLLESLGLFLGLCSAMGGSSFEVPFSPLLFCVAQAPSKGPSGAQEALSDVPLSGQSKQCLRLNRQLFWGAGATQLLSTLPVSLLSL